MAKNQQGTSSSENQSFNREMNDDLSSLPPDSWVRARNAINNSVTGDLGKLGNEPSNKLCIQAPYPIIGFIHINADRWAVFSTNDTDSEIGLFEEHLCKYDKIVNDSCLGFNRANLISGRSRATSDCSYQIYWDDRLNPSRTMDIQSPPFIQICLDENNVDVNTAGPSYVAVGCITCTDTTFLNCDMLRLARFVNSPCLRVARGVSGGTLPNGTYMALVAYTIQGQKMTDYFMPSNQQPLFDHDNVAGSLDIFVDSLDDRYDEFELVIVSVINQQTVARRIGLYSTQQRLITLDNIEATWTTVPIENIFVRTPVYDRSDAMYSVSDFLLRVGPATKTEPNYQPMANQIVTKWVSVEYPENYYEKGGSNTSAMRDEVYPYFIRWIFDTGDKTPSYHIPGRPAINYQGLGFEDDPYVGADSLAGDTKLFETYNTASQTSGVVTTLPDGGVQIAEGYMGYWESSEKYPDRNAEVWDAVNAAHPWTAPNAVPYPGSNVNTDYNLCAKFIRHHKFPDNAINLSTGFSNTITNHYTGSSPNFLGKPAIRILGVKFENIRPPVDNQGNPITNIVAYEILRGSRQGHRSVIAKGMINNMGLYTIDNGITPRQGAYPNYPYNDLRPDPFLVQGETYFKMCIFGAFGGEYRRDTNNPVTSSDYFQNFSKKLYSFHSPDMNFNKPFLSGKEMKVYGEMRGTAIGKFEYSEHHPKFKMVSNMAFIISAISGIGLAALAMNGKRTLKSEMPRKYGQTDPGGGVQVTPGAGLWGLANPPSLAFDAAATGAAMTMQGVYQAYLAGSSGGAALAQNALGLEGDAVAYPILATAITTAALIPGMATYNVSGTEESTAFTETPTPFRLLTFLPSFSYFWAQGTDSIIEIIRAILRFRDFALKYNSRCFYDDFVSPPGFGQRRRLISEQEYLSPQITDFGSTTAGYRINNLHRSKTVALEIDTDLTFPSGIDDTRQRASDRPELTDIGILGNSILKDPTKSFFTTSAASYYVGYKQRIRNQYGQLDSIIQVPISTCPSRLRTIAPPTVMFNGDVYIARYTEKNTFFYFYEWLYDQLDGYEFNYLAARMVPYPRYWLDSQKYESSDFVQGLMSNLANIANPSGWSAVMPSNFFNLDGYDCNGASILQNANFAIKNAFFYLFNSGVRDFFVESEVNIGLRDWGELDTQKHYPILDEKGLFDTAIIKSGNYFKQDPSLNISKNLVQLTSWGKVQDRDFNPSLAETCFDYFPNQVIYSLPANLENKRDQWKFFLANNYKIFLSKITCIKPVSKNGALFMFENESPIQFIGVDQLQTDAGTKITIGDGGLFNQPLQNLVNADKAYEYGSCQDSLSVINTPSGLYYISQNQGKIFNISGNLKEISNNDLKWWFATYLPYKIVEQFPDFQLKDNPVIGVGCQSIYDNENGIVYFMKKDYVLRRDLPSSMEIVYIGSNHFMVDGLLQIDLGDPSYFEDASWTISYDPKTGSWISWHDWHPNLVLPGKNTFMTVLNDTGNPLDANGIWNHNIRCDSYCNFYNTNYPFEVEYMTHTGATVNTLRNIEYYVEVYKYDPRNCYDRFHVLDFGFNEAVIHNTEQCSGLLRLNLVPKNNALQRLAFPIINIDSVDILYSKEEQKYRFNQFWDLTDSRGEFPIGSAYPPPTPNVGTFAERMIWNTEPNGYVRLLNANNLNYSKNPLERKKFRHYVNYVLLRRTFTPDTEGNKMLVMLSQNKNLYSAR